MTIYLENEVEKEYDFSFEEVAKKVCKAALDSEGFPFDAHIEISIVSKETIQEINRENREIDSVTDVLSFPMIDYSTPGDFSHIEDDDMNFDPDSNEVTLGDIIICFDKVKEQADSFGHSCLREYAFLVCHSMLHLMGYDHMSPDEEKVMFGKQDEILHNLGIDR